MSIRTLNNCGMTVLYSSTTDWAFGPIFYDDDEHNSEERAEAFIEWLPMDARKYRDYELENKYSEWLAQEKEQWAAKEKEEEEK